MKASLTCTLAVARQPAWYWHPVLYEALRLGGASFDPPWLVATPLTRRAGFVGRSVSTLDGESGFRAVWNALQTNPKRLSIALHVGEEGDAQRYDVLAEHNLDDATATYTVGLTLPLASLRGEYGATLPAEEQAGRISRFLTSFVALYHLAQPAVATVEWQRQGWLVGRIVPPGEEEFGHLEAANLNPYPPGSIPLDIEHFYLPDGSAFSRLSVIPVPDEGEDVVWVDLPVEGY